MACLAATALTLPLNLDQYLVYASLIPAHGASEEINTELKAVLKPPTGKHYKPQYALAIYHWHRSQPQSGKLA